MCGLVSIEQAHKNNVFILVSELKNVIRDIDSLSIFV